MDWEECIRQRIVKTVSEDRNLIKSTREIARAKIESADALPDHLYIGKITLLYDALREHLECIALEKGYKVYNHECYASFLKEILKLSRDAEIFDNLRKVRNGINYYGRTVTQSEAEQVIRNLKLLIEKFKK